MTWCETGRFRSAKRQVTRGGFALSSIFSEESPMQPQIAPVLAKAIRY
jgi:hypothetical protein